ncbi:MAG TPA: type VII secretion integral membrane protein EccD [Streptosporangiaceae bacterium]|nr:type VII secretion integral membrane protein EccD [Streptosporangiaceae bacterium]
MSPAAGADLCRVTVIGPARRVDIALPDYVPFAELFPAVARYAGLDGPEAAAEQGGWVLQRLGEEPFAPDLTPLQAGLKDGETIYLRPYRAQLPPRVFDDAADAIAAGVNARPGRWEPRHGRWLSLGAAAAALLAGALVIARAGPPWAVPSLAAAAVAVALLAAAAAVARAAGDAVTGAMFGYTAIPYAFLAGLLTPLGHTAHLGAAQLLSAFAAVVFTAVIAAMASTRMPLLLGITGAALLGDLGALIDYLGGGLGLAGAAALVAAVAMALTPLIPALSFRLARMDLPPVPRNADDLRRDTLPIDGADMRQRAAAADGFVTGAAAGTGLVGAGAELALALAHGWLAPLACAALACALLLRSRIFRGIAQRLWLMIPGYGGLVLLAVAAIRIPAQPSHLAAALGSLLAGTALVVGTGTWLPGHRPSPFWGRAADIADTVLIVSLFPLALAVAGVFGEIRGLVG